MPRGIKIEADEIQHILDLFNDSRKRGRSLMDSYTLVAQQVGRDAKTIASLIQRLRPTTDLARMYFRAKAFKMAKRIVKKASPSELIDVLQRPSIGVLDPIKKIDTGPGGFFLSVNAESCGSVKVGVAQLPPAPDLPQLEEGETPFDPFSEVINVNQSLEVQHESHGYAEYRETREEQHETTIERVRRQLKERRESVGAGD